MQPLHKSSTPAHSVLVAGAGSGIGRAIALSFAESGSRLVLTGRRTDALAETASLVADRGADTEVHSVDATDEDAVAALLKAVTQSAPIDVAVNSVGAVVSGPLHELDADDFDSVMQTNVRAVWLLMKHETLAMRAGGRGAIVNIASTIGSHVRIPGMGAYAASKAALSTLTRVAALENISHGVRINAVSPGPVDTPMSLRPGETSADRDSRLAITNPSGRAGSVEEIAALVHWLTSAEASYVVGQDVVVDGGVTA